MKDHARSLAVTGYLLLFAAIVMAQRPDDKLLRPLYYNPAVDSFTEEYYEGGERALYFYAGHGMYRTGWDVVYLELDREFHAKNLTRSYYALGFAEGLATQEAMFALWTNLYPPYWPFASQWDPAMVAWSNHQIDWIKSKVNHRHGEANDTVGDKVYWEHVGAIMAQVDGLVDGYQAAVRKYGRLNESLTWMEVYALTQWFEMYDIRDATSAWTYGSESATVASHYRSWAEARWLHEQSRRLAPQQPPPKPYHRLRQGHCSGYIRITPDDLFMAHDTWTPYNNMNRQYKVYNLSDERSIAFSSYPGTLASGDDWYMISNGLAVQETSIDNFNASSYKYISNESLPEFIRVMVANAIAPADGGRWCELFCYAQGGTYNNQYMVVNMNLFNPNSSQPAPEGLLWVLEQMPLHCVSADMTHLLHQQGFFGSYNIPYFPIIFEVSGTAALEQEYGSFFNYHRYCRGEIFRRNSSSVFTLDHVKALMRYNNFRQDPFSLIPNCSGTPNGVCDPPYDAALSIASRMDLNPPHSNTSTLGPLWNYFKNDYMGAIDSKIVSWKDMMTGRYPSASKDTTTSLVGHLVSGPTVEPQFDIPPFQWSTSGWNGISHIGMPDLWNFTFVSSIELLSPRPPPSP